MDTQEAKDGDKGGCCAKGKCCCAGKALAALAILALVGAGGYAVGRHCALASSAPAASAPVR